MMMLLAIVAGVVYALYRATRKWGARFWFVLAAAVSLLDATGVLAERLWGPQWSWNFSHHNNAPAWGAMFGAIFYLSLALPWRQGTKSR